MPEPASSLEAIRPLLPAWSGWVSLGFPVVAFVLTWCATWCAGRATIGPVRKLGDATWNERARAAFPHRRVGGITAIFPVILVAMASQRIPGPLSYVGPGFLYALTAAAAYLGSFIARRGFASEIQPETESAMQNLGSELVGFVLVAPHVLVLMVLTAVVDPQPTASAWAWLGFGSLAFAGVCWAGGLPLLRWLGVARPADARVAGIVERAAERTGVRPRGVFIVPLNDTNAFAFPPRGQLVFSSGIATLRDEDLVEIAAHELGHLSEPRSAAVARIVGVFALLPFGFVMPISALFGIWGLLLMMAAYYLGMFGLVSVFRRLEARADQVAHATEGNPGAYARALEAVYEANLIPVVTGSRNPTHPDLYDRLCAAGREPSYPRPAPPSSGVLIFGGAVAAVILGVGLGLLLSLANAGHRFLGSPEDASALRVALSGGREGVFDLGVERILAESEDGLLLLQAAVEVRPEGHHAPAYLATSLAVYDRCEEASGALEVAEERANDAQRDACRWILQARELLALCGREEPEFEESAGGGGAVDPAIIGASAQLP